MPFESDLASALGRLDEERRRLLALVAPLGAGDMGRARAGGWSAGRVVHHVIESEAVYAKLLAHQCGRPAADVDTAEPADGADAAAKLASTRGAVLAAVEGIDEATLYRFVTFGREEYSALSVLENIAAHDADHYGQVASLLAARPERQPAATAAVADVLVRPARSDDLPRLTEIYNHYVVNTPITFDTEPFSIEQRVEWLARYSTTGRHRLLVAERDGIVLGYTSTSPFHPRRAYETTVETTVLCAPEAVGLGLGGLLYGALFDALQGEDVHVAIAVITLPNEASCALHERFGFTRAAVLSEVGRKFGRYWDVAWYVRDTTAEPFRSPA